MMSFVKVDFHIHSPASICYDDHTMPEAGLRTTPQDIVAAATAAGMKAIAITDHHSVEGVDAIRKAARDGLAVFPGMEITARGGHLLALFPLDISLPYLRQFIASLGLTRENMGDGFHQLGLWIDEVCRRVAQEGGLAIAAHVDRYSRGFLASDETLADKVRIYYSPYLAALEITSPKDKEQWNLGHMPHYPLGRACLLGSDAHAPGEIGRRFTYVDLPEVSLEGLRRAFQDYQHRVRFPGELPQNTGL